MFFKPYYDVDKILEGLQQPMWRVPPNMDGAKALADEIELLRTKLSARDRELSAVREERDDLLRRAREVTCVWCGHQFVTTLQSQADELYEHAKVCPKHPVNKAESELARVKAELDEVKADRLKLHEEFEAYVEKTARGAHSCHAACPRPLCVMRRERDEAMEALALIINRHPKHHRDGNAPGHGHKVAGVWDDDNGDKAGTPCEWCGVWNGAAAVVAKYPK